MMSVGYGDFTRILKCLVAIVFIGTAVHAENAATRPPEAVTLFALGDSLTAGYGLDQGDGFTDQLQQWLQAQGVDATVINAGVSGDTSAGGAARLGWVLGDEVDAVIVALGGNDMLRGIAPEETYKNLDRILNELTDRKLPSLLVGLPGPANFGPAYKTAFEQAYVDLASAYDVPLYPSFMAGIQSATMSQADALPYFQRDAIHPNKQGVALIVAHMGPEIIAMLQSAGLVE